MAEDNYAALKSFFHMYPEYKTNDFYLTGKSYGGFYIPVLSVLIAKDDAFNFKVKLVFIICIFGCTNFIVQVLYNYKVQPYPNTTITSCIKYNTFLMYSHSLLYNCFMESLSVTKNYKSDDVFIRKREWN